MAILPPPPRELARVAATQPVTQAPTSRVIGRRVRSSKLDARFRPIIQERQDKARFYAQTLPPARYAANNIKNTVQRVRYFIEEQKGPEEWEETTDDSLAGLLDVYRNERFDQDITELASSIAYRYTVDGEMVQIVKDGTNGPDFMVYSLTACDFKRDVVVVNDVPGGSVRDGGAYEVPRAQVQRFWIPNEEYPGLATSPTMAGVDALDGYAWIWRKIQAIARSRIAFAGGKVWAMGNEAHDEKIAPNSPVSKMEQDYSDLGEFALEGKNDLRAVLPPLFHWDWKEPAGAGEVIDLGLDIDESDLNALQVAKREYATAMDQPASLVEQGGGADANHWNEWLNDERAQAMLSWLLSMIAHRNLTEAFLEPILTTIGKSPEKFRVGYDISKIVTRPDRSESSRQLNEAGALRFGPMLEAHGFDPEKDSLIDPKWTAEQEREWLIAVRSAGKTGQIVPGEVQAPETVRVTEQTPPAAQGEPKPPPEAPPEAGAGAQPSNVTKLPPPQPTRAAAMGVLPKANKVAARINAIRKDTRVKLKTAVETATRDALGHAVRKAAVWVENKSPLPADEKRATAHAIREGVPIRRFQKPRSAALGLTESELLDDRFGEFTEQAEEMFRNMNAKQQRLLIQAGLDPDEFYTGDDESARRGAGFLAAVGLAVARGLLTEGPEQPTPRGERSGIIPSTAVGEAMLVDQGERNPQFGSSPDEMPTTVDGDENPLHAEIAEQLGLGTTYTWVWGAAGEPDFPFEPHLDLDGTEYEDPEIDDDGNVVHEALSSLGDFTDGDVYHPGDHKGCTCAWDVTFTAPAESTLAEATAD